MKSIVIGFILSLLFCTNAFADVTNPNKKISHIIYVTMDGTRWQDIFQDHQYLQKFWDRYVAKSHKYGEPNSKTTMEVAAIPVSLPSYQSQMAGSVQPCNGNGCGRIGVETVMEKIVNTLHLSKKEVAVFSSWKPIELAAEHIPNSVFTNTGNRPVYDPDTQQADEVMFELNRLQARECLGSDRSDKFTFAQAMHYFEKYNPKFLWISLGDADEAAHASNLKWYHEVLAFYDNALDILFTTLKKLNLEDETLVIITTDHGRGNGVNWTTHGPEYPESKQTWAFTFNGEFKPVTSDGAGDHYSTISIRPAMEGALGITA